MQAFQRGNGFVRAESGRIAWGNRGSLHRRFRRGGRDVLVEAQPTDRAAETLGEQEGDQLGGVAVAHHQRLDRQRQRRVIA